jgi:hypothetical protein
VNFYLYELHQIDVCKPPDAAAAGGFVRLGLADGEPASRKSGSSAGPMAASEYA